MTPGEGPEEPRCSGTPPLHIEGKNTKGKESLVSSTDRSKGTNMEAPKPTISQPGSPPLGPSQAPSLSHYTHSCRENRSGFNVSKRYCKMYQTKSTKGQNQTLRSKAGCIYLWLQMKTCRTSVRFNSKTSTTHGLRHVHSTAQTVGLRDRQNKRKKEDSKTTREVNPASPPTFHKNIKYFLS